MLRGRLRPTQADKLGELGAQDDEPGSAVVPHAIRRFLERVESEGK